MHATRPAFSSAEVGVTVVNESKATTENAKQPTVSKRQHFSDSEVTRLCAAIKAKIDLRTGIHAFNLRTISLALV